MKLLKHNIKVNLFVKQTVNVLEKDMEILNFEWQAKNILWTSYNFILIVLIIVSKFNISHHDFKTYPRQCWRRTKHNPLPWIRGI